MLKKGKSRKQKRQRKKGKRPESRQVLYFEPLEPRILLSADLVYSTSGGSHDLTLQVQNVDGVDTVQLVDMQAADGVVLASQALSDTNNVVITGSAENDRLTIDFTNPFRDHAIFFSDMSQADSDVLRIIGPDETTWDVTGKDSGSVEGVSFDHVENLTGDAGNNDTFIFGQNGSLAGRIEGGAGGFDTLVIDGVSSGTVAFTPTGPESGFVDLDGNLISYAGLEPIIYDGTATDMIFNLSGDGDHAVLETSGTGLRLRSTNGTFEETDFSAPTGSLTINGQDGDDSVVLAGDLYIDNAMDLTVNAESITVDSGAYIHANEIFLHASASRNGGVDSLADSTYDLFFDSALVGNAAATVQVTGATLQAWNIEITSSSEVALNTDGAGLSDLRAAVAYATSDAEAIVQDSTIIASGNLTISAGSTISAAAILNADPSSSDGELDAAIAVTYGESTAVARVSGASTLEVGGDVKISADNIVTLSSVADGGTGGSGVAGAALALSIARGETTAYVDGTAALDDSDDLDEADSISVTANAVTTATARAVSTLGGAQENTSSGNKTQDKLGQYGASTGEGDVGVAAAAAITDVTRPVDAYVSSGGAMTTTGDLDVASSSTGRASSIADGTATGSGSVGVGVVVALNLADLDSTAHIGGTGGMTADTVNVDASMDGRNWVFDPSGAVNDATDAETIDTRCCPRVQDRRRRNVQERRRHLHRGSRGWGDLLHHCRRCGARRNKARRVPGGCEGRPCHRP
jgi:hypothetical protein